MLYKIMKNRKDLVSFELYNQVTFYDAFLRDIKRAKAEVIIESPFITAKRLKPILPMIEGLIKKGIKVIVNTKPSEEHDDLFYLQSKQGVADLQRLGVLVLFTGGHHRKLAVIDRSIVWEGSLNILSQNDSCELMKRTNSKDLAKELIRFIGLNKYLR
jgi:phosphatidylserine/phosphatidylglycerophosphate/cardiolipin synthase-like enzyme